MSSDRLVPIVDLKLGASRTLSMSVTAVTVLAVIAVFESGLPVWLKCLLDALIVAGAVRWLFVEGLRQASSSIVRLVLMDEEECMLVERAGAQRSMRVVHAAVITSSLAFVTLRFGRWRTRTLCIAVDAVDDDSFRRLRTRLSVSSPASGWAGLRRRRSEQDLSFAHGEQADNSNPMH